MRGVVLQVENEYTWFLDETGCFRKMKSRPEHAVGAEIDVSPEPVPPARKSERKLAQAHGRPVLRRRRRLRFRHVTSVAALILLLIGCTIFTNVWDSASYSLYLDINPSVRLEANSLDQIISYTPLNADGEALLESSRPRGSVVAGVATMISEAQSANLVTENGVQLTVVTEDAVKFKALEKLLSFNVYHFDVEVICVTPEEEQQAFSFGVTPMKYRRAQQVAEAFPDISLEQALGVNANVLKKILKGELKPEQVFG
jgi:hypothetical protein